MATYTENYNLEKPSLDEVVDVNVLNNNYDTIDEALGNTQTLASNIGSNYNSIIAYNVGDYCIYNNNLYKCVQATSSGDSFNPAKWQICKVTDDLGGTEVVANPSGSATTTLTKLQVEDTIYNISGGGGGGSIVIVTPTLQSGTKVADIDVDGTTSSLYAPTPTEVEANPSSTGTDTLTKLKVGSTTYNVSQGGGSSTLAGLNDVDLNNSTDGQVLKYDSTNQKWVNANEDSGSTVTWNQITQTGTKIATVNIDGTATDVYAPTSGGGSSSWKDITGTLTAGQTSITLTDSSILESSTFDFYTSKFGINPTNVSVLNGSITLTFDEQSTDLDVKIRVTNEESPYIFKEYLEVGDTAGAYINTNLKFATTHEFEVKLQMYGNQNNNTIHFGRWVSNKDSMVYFYDNKIRWKIGAGGEYNADNDLLAHVYKATQTQMLVDGVDTEITPNWSNVPINENYYMFKEPDHNGVINSRIYYVKIWDNGTLIRDFVPAVRKSDNEIGMYDRVNDVFYTNDGTGTFTTN